MVAQYTYVGPLVLPMKYQDLEDADLLALTAAGRREALEVFYEKYSSRVFSLAVHMLRDREAAEEVTQDVFMNVWRRSSSYQANRGSVAAWLFGIAHNRTVDELRRRRRQGITTEIEEIDLERYLVSSFIDPQENAAINEDRHLVRKALGELRPEQRDVIILAYFKGYSHSEIAEHLSQPLGTVKTRMRLAMKKLREVIGLS